MAKIWAVYEGNRPTVGGPWATIPLPEAIALFELRRDDFLSDLEITPRFGLVDGDLTFVGYKHIVVEVERNEGRQANWKSGFYKSRIKPKEAFGILIKQAVVAVLGQDNVVHVGWEPTVDSQGQEALRIIVVITPDATQKLKGGAVLDVLVSLQRRLNEMRENRIPMIEYATEAELQQDAGP
jgi:hypothetical protein